MKFNIERTSDTFNRHIPIQDERVKLEHICYDTWDNSESYRVYTIEFKTIEEFIDFINSLDIPQVVIIKNKIKTCDFLDKPRCTEDYTIEIYDDWREQERQGLTPVFLIYLKLMNKQSVQRTRKYSVGGIFQPCYPTYPEFET